MNDNITFASWLLSIIGLVAASYLTWGPVAALFVLSGIFFGWEVIRAIKS